MKREGLCGCLCMCMCMSVAFLMRWPHTIAELKVVSPFKQEQYGHQCYLTSSCLGKASFSTPPILSFFCGSCFEFSCGVSFSSNSVWLDHNTVLYLMKCVSCLAVSCLICVLIVQWWWHFFMFPFYHSVSKSVGHNHIRDLRSDFMRSYLKL